MKKKLIAICLSALMLTSVTSVNCMAENPYPDEESYSESSFAILQDILRENDCQTGIAFLGYIGYDATTKKFWIIQTKRIMSHLIRFLKMVPSWMRVVMKSLRSFRLRTGRSAYTPLR